MIYVIGNMFLVAMVFFAFGFIVGLEAGRKEGKK